MAGRLLVMLLVLSFFLGCSPGGSALFFNEIGEVIPDDPHPFVGENVELFCKLNKKSNHKNSSYLFFSRDGEEISSDHVEIINETTILLSYPIREPGDALFVCRLKKKGCFKKRRRCRQRSNTRIKREDNCPTCATVGAQHVEADYQPINVTSLNCVVYNWSYMTCHWDLRQQYTYKNYTNVSLDYTISEVKKKCPKMNGTTSCTWPATEFIPGAIYRVYVEVQNTKRGVSANSSFRIETAEIVEPDPVHDLQVTERNATCLHLTWKHSDKWNGKRLWVQYCSEWMPDDWTNLTHSFKDSPVNAELICGLTPFTAYVIRVAVSPEVNGNPVGFRSAWVNVNGSTNASVPEMGPPMCPGCFTYLQTSNNGHREVILYWKPIPKPKSYSLINEYRLNISSSNCPNKEANTTTTCAIVTLQANCSYQLQLYAVTPKNETSLNFSSIVLPSAAQQPTAPTGFVVETKRVWEGKLHLRWDIQNDTYGYLITWCLRTKSAFMCDCDKETVQWENRPASTTSYVLENLTGGRDDYLVGLSRQVMREGNIISSGITWSKCIYNSNEVPEKLKTVKAESSGKVGGLIVRWEPPGGCSNAYITHYVVCINSTEKNVPRTDDSVLLQGLTPGAKYQVTVAAVSENGTKIWSDPISGEVLESAGPIEDFNGTIVAVVSAIIPATILILVGFCKIRGRYFKTLAKFGEPGKQPRLPLRRITRKKDSPNQIRPLPLVPSEGFCYTTTISGIESDIENNNDHTDCHGKQAVIRMGDEEPLIASNTRLLYHSGVSPTSETARLLPEDEKVPEKQQMSMYSVYDAESGSSTDPGYCTMSDDTSIGRCHARGDNLGVGAVATAGYLHPDDLKRGAASAPMEKDKDQNHVKPTPGHLTHSAANQHGYMQALVIARCQSSCQGIQQRDRVSGERRKSFPVASGITQPKSSTLTASGFCFAEPSTHQELTDCAHRPDDNTFQPKPLLTSAGYVSQNELISKVGGTLSSTHKLANHSNHVRSKISPLKPSVTKSDDVTEKEIGALGVGVSVCSMSFTHKPSLSELVGKFQGTADRISPLKPSSGYVTENEICANGTGGPEHTLSGSTLKPTGDDSYLTSDKTSETETSSAIVGSVTEEQLSASCTSKPGNNISSTLEPACDLSTDISEPKVPAAKAGYVTQEESFARGTTGLDNNLSSTLESACDSCLTDGRTLQFHLSPTKAGYVSDKEYPCVWR